VPNKSRAAPRREILEAAGRCFGERGFHSTSMQDFFAASGLSAGLVYRYFRSKDELLAELAAEALEQLHASVEEATAAAERPGTEEVLARLLRTIDELDTRERIARVAVHVWGEALVNPAVGSAFTAEIVRLQAAMERLVATAQADGQLDPDL